MRTVFVFIFLASAYVCTAQVPHFLKYDIAESGCAAYFPEQPEFELSLSDDSSKVYTTEVTFNNIKFALICVAFAVPFEGTKEENTVFLESYLDFLQNQFEITRAAGYGEGHILDSHPEAAGVIDFWEGDDGLQYNVKAWIDNNYLAVLMIYSDAEINYNISELFLNGFRFPED